MSLHVEERDDGYALFIDGDLQFDTADEALYHESLALPALCLSRPPSGEGLKVLICGGGDGLALRECLRFPGVAHADLVDYDPEVVALGRTRFADLNQDAFDDPRVTVHLADAWEFLADSAPYDVILCDFTVPRTPEDTRIFTVEWYRRVREALAPGGVAALNAVSPQATPEAFWCLRRTVQAAGLSVLPYRVCIPSFREQGYGAWGFLLAARRPLRQTDLRALACPVATWQAEMTRLWRGARFSRIERALEERLPVHSLDNPCLLDLLLNPGLPADLSTPDSRLSTLDSPFDIAPLLRAIPITHPYHTREMVETLAEQVVGAIRTLDLRRLVELLLRRAAQLPGDLVRELGRLRDFLREHGPDLSGFRTWSYRLFAALVITMVLANAVAPDNAFAKGAHGLGHASMSRGYFSGGFAGGRGEVAPGVGRGGGFGGSYTPARITGRGFRSGYGNGVTDIYGQTYRPRVFRYYYFGGHHHGVGHTNGTHAAVAAPAPPIEQHSAIFAADDDMIVLDNGDVIVTLSDAAYLLVANGAVTLMTDRLEDPLLALYPDPKFLQAVREQLADQQIEARQAAQSRRDWLGWVGWTGALFPVVAGDRVELRNLEDLNRRLEAARARIGSPPPGASPTIPTPGSTELFVGAYLLADGTVAMRGPNQWFYTDGRRLREGEGPKAKVRPCPPELAAALKSVMQKLQKELAADIASDDNDLRLIQTDRVSLEKDMQEYQRLAFTYGYGYEVDYGTDTMSAQDAITRTETDLMENTRDYNETLADRVKSAADLERINTSIHYFAP